MGLTRLAMTVSNVCDAANSREIRFMVDSGAIHSLVPRQILSELGILPQHVRVSHWRPSVNGIAFIQELFMGEPRVLCRFFGGECSPK